MALEHLSTLSSGECCTGGAGVDSGRTIALGIRRSGTAPVDIKTKAPSDLNISRLNHTAFGANRRPSGRRPHHRGHGFQRICPLVHYVVTNEVPSILSQGGHQLVVHTIVTGGQALVDTLHGAAQLVKQLEDARFVVWLNPLWGPVALDGKTFEQMKVYQDIKKRIETVVNLPAFTDELFPQDIASMLNSRLTFKEAIESPDHSLMSRHRLKVAQREFYSRLDSLAV